MKKFVIVLGFFAYGLFLSLTQVSAAGIVSGQPPIISISANVIDNTKITSEQERLSNESNLVFPNSNCSAQVSQDPCGGGYPVYYYVYGWVSQAYTCQFTDISVNGAPTTVRMYSWGNAADFYGSWYGGGGAYTSPNSANHFYLSQTTYGASSSVKPLLMTYPGMWFIPGSTILTQTLYNSSNGKILTFPNLDSLFVTPGVNEATIYHKATGVFEKVSYDSNMVSSHISDTPSPVGLIVPSSSYLPVFVNNVGWYYIGTDNKNYILSADLSTVQYLSGFDGQIPLLYQGGVMYFSKSANGKYVTKVEGDNITLSNGNGLSAFYYKVNLQDLSKNYGISYITSNSSPYRLTADYLSDSTKQSTDLNMPLSSNIIAVSTSYAANGDLYIMYASDSAGNPPFKYYVLKKGETTQQLISSGIPVSGMSFFKDGSAILGGAGGWGMPGPNYFIISTDGSITNTNLVSSDYSYSPDWCVENYTQNTISATSDDKRYILYNHSSSHTDWCTWNSAPSDSNTYLRDMLTGTDTVVTGIGGALALFDSEGFLNRVTQNVNGTRQVDRMNWDGTFTPKYTLENSSIYLYRKNKLLYKDAGGVIHVKNLTTGTDVASLFPGSIIAANSFVMKTGEYLIADKYMIMPFGAGSIALNLDNPTEYTILNTSITLDDGGWTSGQSGSSVGVIGGTGYAGIKEFDNTFLKFSQSNQSTIEIPLQYVQTGVTKVDVVTPGSSDVELGNFLKKSKTGMFHLGNYFFKSNH